MNPTTILGAILILVLLYGIFNILFVKTTVATELKLKESETIKGTSLIELENKKYSDYTHSFFIFLIDKPTSSSSLATAASEAVNGHSLVEREAKALDGASDKSNGHFQVYITNDGTKLVARAVNDNSAIVEYNGVQHIGIKYQQHIFVAIVVKRNTMDLYLNGQLVSAGVFEHENKAEFYNQDIYLSRTENFKSTNGTNLGFLHSYRYTDRSLTAEEIAVLYNSYVASYSRNSTTDYSAKLSLTRDGDELTDLTKVFTF